MSNQYYEICLVVGSGPIGINLQSARGDRGAFVESFYRADDGRVLDAEGSEQICVGDQISHVADDDVLDNHLDDIRSKLLLYHRPFQIRFRRAERVFHVEDIALDPRAKLWINAYLEDYCSVVDGCILRKKIDLYFLARLLFDYFDGRPDGNVQDNNTTATALRELCLECLGCCLDEDDTLELQNCGLLRDVNAVSNLECVRLALCHLEDYLSNIMLVKFQQCGVAKKLAGWMSNSPPFYAYSIVRILEHQILSACYFLHLCTLDGCSHRFLHILLNKRQRSARRYCASPESNKLQAIQQRVVLQAAQEGLLYSFYESATYEHLLRTREQADISSDVLHHILRTLALPLGISIHRRGGPSVCSLTSLSPPAESEPGCILLFDTPRIDSIIRVTASAALVVEDGQLASRPAPPAVLAAPVVRFLAPGGSRRTSSDGEAPPPQLVSYAITMKGDVTVFGASLIFYRSVVMEETPLQVEHASQPMQPGDAEDEHVRGPGDLEVSVHISAEPAATPSVEITLGSIEDVPSVLPSSAASLDDQAPACSVGDTTAESVPVSGLAGKRSASHDSLLSLMLAKSQAGALQSSLVMAKVRDGAGDIFRGIKQWSEHAVPSMHLPALLTHAHSAPHTADASLRITTENSHRSDVHEADQSSDQYHSIGAVASATTYQLLPRGLSVLSTEPKIECLRRMLRLAARHFKDGIADSGAEEEHSATAAAMLEAVLQTWSTAEDLLQDLCAPSLQDGSATDFDPRAVFEALCPRNLVTVYIACLLEYRVVLVSTRHTVGLLVGEWLKLAIHPLKWCHIYAPVVPQPLALELLQCPAPYLLGMLRETLEASPTPPPAGTLVVDLDNDTVTVPADLKAAMPAAESVVEQLASILQPNLTHCDDGVNYDQRAEESNLSDPLSKAGPALLCRQYLQHLLKPLAKCIVVLDDSAAEMTVALDEELFLRKVCGAVNINVQNRDSLVLLVNQLMRAQSFSEHVLAVAASFKEAK